MKKVTFVFMSLLLAGLLCGVFEAVRPTTGSVDVLIMERSSTDRSTPNPVAAVLYDFKVLDTLLTIGCLFASVCSIGALFRDGGRRE